MLVISCILGTVISCVVTSAVQKCFSTGLKLYYKHQLNPEDLERISKIQEIYSAIQEIAQNDASRKSLVNLLQVSIMGGLEKVSSEELKEIEVIMNKALLEFCKTSLSAA
ncbi:MAG: hypothetical protein JSS09_07980 [Verrucomicrobia bacterium]|nr:hypothetical protein [Verrucomicrobiota bacterium]